jgi:hypothetical protein
VTPVPDEAALRVEGLYAGYGGGDILHDVSFIVPEGGARYLRTQRSGPCTSAVGPVRHPAVLP